MTTPAPGITDSRNKKGTLTIDGAPYATQATNVRLESKTDDAGDALEVLSGDVITPDDTTAWTLVVEAVQDFDDPQGFVNYTLQNAGELVPYSWKPSPASPTYSGTCRVRPPKEIGGDVAKRLSAEYEFPTTGTPTATYAPA